MTDRPSTEADPFVRTTATWREAGERGDAEAAARCFAADIEVISPLTAQFRFRGREQAEEMLAAAFQVISDIRYHTEAGEGPTRALFYHGRCGREPVEEAQLLRFDTDGLITELTLFGRPLPAVTAIMARIGPTLLHREGRHAAARAVAAATKPLAATTRLGDQYLVPRADPSRP